MEPIPQIEVNAVAEELPELAAAMPGYELWRREQSYLAVPTGSWLRLHQAWFGY